MGKAQLIDGKTISKQIKDEIKLDIDKWVALGHKRPKLVAVLVGEDPASQKYVKNKMVAAEYVGIDSETKRLDSNITQSDLLQCIEQLNNDKTVDGILIQLPVPVHIDERTICNAVDPDKDVDGFNNSNIGKLCLNVDTFIPCTALGVIELIKRSSIDTFGKNVVVCGRSKNVGLPIAMLLHSDANNAIPGHEATTTICHRNTPPEQLAEHVKKADIVVTATGVRNLIKPEFVKPGSCIIDVGLIRITDENGKEKLVGDVDFEGVSEVAGHITPVPGGVGPMTVAILMQNTLKAAKMAVEKQN